MSLQELERDILKLPAEERARLAAWLNNLPQNLQQEEVVQQQHAENNDLTQAIADSLAGRVTPLEVWAARTRVRYGITENTKPFTPEELDALP